MGTARMTRAVPMKARAHGKRPRRNFRNHSARVDHEPMGNDHNEIQKSRVPDFCTSHAPDVTYIYDGFLGCSRTGRFPGLRAGVGSAHGAAQTREPAAPRWVRHSFVLAGRFPGLRTFMGSAHEGTQTRNAPRKKMINRSFPSRRDLVPPAPPSLNPSGTPAGHPFGLCFSLFWDRVAVLVRFTQKRRHRMHILLISQLASPHPGAFFTRKPKRRDKPTLSQPEPGLGIKSGA